MVTDLRDPESPEEYAKLTLDEVVKLSLPQPEPPTCIICGLRGCTNIGDLNARGEVKEYCCLCLPPELITKPIRTWLCVRCALRQGKLQIEAGGQ